MGNVLQYNLISFFAVLIHLEFFYHFWSIVPQTSSIPDEVFRVDGSTSFLSVTPLVTLPFFAGSSCSKYFSTLLREPIHMVHLKILETHYKVTLRGANMG